MKHLLLENTLFPFNLLMKKNITHTLTKLNAQVLNKGKQLQKTFEMTLRTIQIYLLTFLELEFMDSRLLLML